MSWFRMRNLSGFPSMWFLNPSKSFPVFARKQKTMGKIDRFEDLHCWQSARELTKLVFKASEMGKLARDFETRAQIKGAALSSMSNIAEGFGRGGNKEFLRFLNFSQSSSTEVKSISYALEDSLYLPLELIEEIRQSAEKSKGLTLGLMNYIRQR